MKWGRSENENNSNNKQFVPWTDMLFVHNGSCFSGTKVNAQISKQHSQERNCVVGSKHVWCHSKVMNLFSQNHMLFDSHATHHNYFSQTQPVLTLVKQLGGHFSIAAAP